MTRSHSLNPGHVLGRAHSADASRIAPDRGGRRIEVAAGSGMAGGWRQAGSRSLGQLAERVAESCHGLVDVESRACGALGELLRGPGQHRAGQIGC